MCAECRRLAPWVTLDRGADEIGYCDIVGSK